jgi:hypothetical protein
MDGYPLFTWSILESAIRSKPASFFHNSVRNVCVVVENSGMANVHTLLSVCTNLQDFSLLPSYMAPVETATMPSLVAPLTLTRFTTHLLHRIIDTLPPTQFASPA